MAVDLRNKTLSGPGGWGPYYDEGKEAQKEAYSPYKKTDYGKYVYDTYSDFMRSDQYDGTKDSMKNINILSKGDWEAEQILADAGLKDIGTYDWSVEGDSVLQRLNSMYNNLISQYQNQMQTARDAAVALSDQGYNQNRRNAYIAYRKNQAQLPNQLRQMGITGGASETAQLRANTNYQNQTGAIDSQKASARNQIYNDYQDAFNEYALALNAQRASDIYNEEVRIAERNYENFMNTLDRFQTVKQCDAWLKRYKDQPNWKIRAVKDRRGEIQAAEKAAKKK